MGAGIVASRFAVAEVPPLTLAMLRYAIGFACLLPFALRELPQVRDVPALHTRGRDVFAIGAIGVVQFGLLIALLNWGLQRIGSAPAALIFSLFPLITLMLSSATGQERMTWRLAAGVLLSVAGVALSLSPKLRAMHVGEDLWGEAAVALAAVLGASCSVLYRPYLRRYPTVPVSAFAMLASVFVLAGAAGLEHWPSRIGGFSAGAWAAIAFIGVSSGAGYFAWLYALKHEAPTRVTVFLALNPVTAALLGWVLLGEALHAEAGAALVLIAAGLWLATRVPR